MSAITEHTYVVEQVAMRLAAAMIGEHFAYRVVRKSAKPVLREGNVTTIEQTGENFARHLRDAAAEQAALHDAVRRAIHQVNEQRGEPRMSVTIALRTETHVLVDGHAYTYIDAELERMS